MIEGSIPVVDLKDFFSEHKKKSFIKEVGNALENIGFFAVKNHSILVQLKNMQLMNLSLFFQKYILMVCLVILRKVHIQFLMFVSL